MADTTQITVRIPTELVDWIDGEVAAGRAASRAAALTRIARRAQRNQQAERGMARLLVVPAGVTGPRSGVSGPR